MGDCGPPHFPGGGADAGGGAAQGDFRNGMRRRGQDELWSEIWRYGGGGERQGGFGGMGV